MKDNPKKEEASRDAKRLVISGLTVRYACRLTGISVMTYYKYAKKDSVNQTKDIELGFVGRAIERIRKLFE